MSGSRPIENVASVLRRLPEGDLLQMAELLEDPSSRSELLKLLQAVLALVRAHAGGVSDAEEPRSAGRPHKAIPAGGSGRRSTEIRSTRALSDAVAAFLQNRAVFPSTRDVLAAVNFVLDSRLAYESFRRSGRKALIREFLSRLKQVPSRERHRRVKLLFDRFDRGRPEADEYRDLFRVLTGDEQGA